MIALFLIAAGWASPDVECAPRAFRAAAATMAAEQHPADGEPRSALLTFAKEQGRQSGSCPVQPTPACAASAQTEVQAAALARAEVAASIDRAQAHETIPTSLDMAREAAAVGARELPEEAGSELRAAYAAAGAKGALAFAEAERAAAARAAAEAELRRAERAWLEAAVPLNRSRCAPGCDAIDCQASARDEASLAKLRALYDALAATDADFLMTWSSAALADRVVGGGAGGPTEGTPAARAAWLRRALADSAARPASARSKLAQYLADNDGAGAFGAEGARGLIAWLAFERAWRDAVARLPARIDAVIAAWKKADAATTQRARMIARDRLLVSMRQLEATGATPP